MGNNFVSGCIVWKKIKKMRSIFKNVSSIGNHWLCNGRINIGKFKRKNSTSTASTTTCPEYLYFHPGFSEEFEDKFVKSFGMIPDFINEEEEVGLFKEVEPHLKRLVYEKSHWDDAIHDFRETERKNWKKANSQIIQRLKDASFSSEKGDKILPYVHVLDLSEKGFIKPHVDSVRFCGNTVAVLSLLSDCIARFRMEKESSQIVDAKIYRRSL